MHTYIKKTQTNESVREFYKGVGNFLFLYKSREEVYICVGMHFTLKGGSVMDTSSWGAGFSVGL
jgi:hypothetical protein